MAREAMTVERKPVTSVRPITDRPANEPSGEPAPWRQDDRAAAAKSYKRPYAFGTALVVAVLGALAYLRLSASSGHPQRPSSSVAMSESRQPSSAGPARTALARPVPALPMGDPDSGYSGFPLQPVEPLPPAMSRWTIPPSYTPASTTAPKGVHTVRAPVPGLAATPPVVAPPHLAMAVPPVAAAKPVTVLPAAPRPAPQPPARIATAPGSDSLPPGTPLHLQIVYTPSGAQEAGHVASLAAALRTEVDAIATSGSSAGPVTTDAVAYFFPDDRAGAAAVAASLARLTKRPEPVELLHRKPLPRPGTVEILLPLKRGKDWTNESS